MNTKAFLKSLEAMVKRAFDTLHARCPDFELYTVLIHIDFKTPRETKSKAVCTIGFDDLQNSLKCTKIWEASLHPRYEYDGKATRTYDPQTVRVNKVETIECDDVNVKDAVSALKNYKRSSLIDVTVNAEAQKFNTRKDALLIFEFEQFWFGRSGRDIFDLPDADESIFEALWKLLCIAAIIYSAYKLLT